MPAADNALAAVYMLHNAASDEEAAQFRLFLYEQCSADVLGG